MKISLPKILNLVSVITLSLFMVAKTASAQVQTVIEIGPAFCSELFTSETSLDPVNALNPSAFALNLPMGTFRFRAPGQFLDFGDGTAQLVGEIYDQNDPARGFYVDIRFTGKIGFSDPSFPPAGSPVLDLTPSAYGVNGGSIEPFTWVYFTAASGSMYGIHDLTGASIAVSDNGPAFQLGEGASNKTLQMGASANLQFNTVTQPYASIVVPTNMNGDLTMTMGFDCAEIGRLSRPGTGEDFQIRTGAFGLRPLGGVGFDKKLSLDGDLVTVEIESPGGTFTNQQIALGVDCFQECNPAPPTAASLPYVYINQNYGGFMVIGAGAGGLIPGPIFLPPSGYTVVASVPPGFSGMNFILQAFCLTPMSDNGIYAASNAHTIKIF
ncbi:MAG: hypothetical protein ACI97A_003570 [Planctomycetota bacterium]|jgi:hypothetical protein